MLVYCKSVICGVIKCYKIEGLNLALNSFYSPIHRVYIPDKPVSCSTDYNYLYSMSMYKIWAEITNTDINMVEVFTTAYVVWVLYGYIVLFCFFKFSQLNSFVN